MGKGNVALLLSVLLGLSGCGAMSTTEVVKTSIEVSDVDFTMLLNMNPLTSNFIVDFDNHIGASGIEQRTGKSVDYISSMVGEEATSFLFMMVGRELPDLLKIDLETNYSGGVESAIEDGMVLDATQLVAQYAPYFMSYLEGDSQYQKSAYTDSGRLAQFGATIVAEQLRDIPMYGPMVNQDYLDQCGLEPPTTIADWEEMLQAFQEIGVKYPLSFGAETDFSVLYDTFASCFGVTAGDSYFHEEGVVKYSPLEAGYYDFLVLMNRWYEKGWLDVGFAGKDQETVESGFLAGTVGATVAHCNLSAREGSNLIPVSYPVILEGDPIATRHFTPDFIGEPIFIHSEAENPKELIEWVDFFYSEEGKMLTNWGEEGVTYQYNEEGQPEFTDFVLENPDNQPVVFVLAENVLQEMALVQDIDFEMQFYSDPRQQNCWDVWSSATSNNCMPSHMTYTLSEREIFTFELDKLPKYVQEMTVKFITGQESFEKYDKFISGMLQLDAQEFLEINQAAYDRYIERNE